jgi:16S rRNA (guanine966-N2)-methyltransferase
MRLRIVSGDLGGRIIQIGGDAQWFRPTVERCRQAVAETIKQSIPGALVVDLCAGSGAFGFEMLSRGATAAHFVEVDRQRAMEITKHARLFRVEDRCTVHAADVSKFLRRCTDHFDIAFYDPPYDDDALASLVPSILPILTDAGTLLYERSSSRAPAVPHEGILAQTRVYGDTSVDFLRRAPNVSQMPSL